MNSHTHVQITDKKPLEINNLEWFFGFFEDRMWPGKTNSATGERELGNIEENHGICESMQNIICMLHSNFICTLEVEDD